MSVPLWVCLCVFRAAFNKLTTLKICGKHTHTHTHACTHMHTHTHTCMHAHIHTHTEAASTACNQANNWKPAIKAHTHTHTHTRMHVHIHTYTHTHRSSVETMRSGKLTTQKICDKYTYRQRQPFLHSPRNDEGGESGGSLAMAVVRPDTTSVYRYVQAHDYSRVQTRSRGGRWAGLSWRG